MSNTLNKMSKKKYEKFVLVVILIISLFSSWIKITHGFDIDEGYAISLGLRLHQGGKVISDLWDPYQFSGAFLKPFIDFFYVIKNDSNFLVIYTRICSSLIHFLISAIVFIYLNKETKKMFLSGILALCYFNFLPKQIQNIDHATVLIWFLTLFTMSIYSFQKTYRKKYLILMSLSFCGMILAYPTQLFLFPFILLILYRIVKKNESSKIIMETLIIFTAICVLIGSIVIFLVNPSVLYHNLANIVSDGSHSFTLQYHFTRIVNGFFRLTFMGLPLFLVSYFINKLLNIKTNLVFNGITGVICIFSLVAIVNLLGLPWAPLSLYMRYLVLSIVGYLIVIKENNKEVTNLFLVSFLTASICFLSSNNGIDSASGFLIISSILSLILIVKYLSKIQDKKILIYVSILISSVLASEILLKINSVRLTSSVFANRASVTMKGDGLLKGIWIQEDKFNYYSDAEYLLNKVDKNLIYCGSEGVIQFFDDFHLITPTTTGTPSFNQQWIEYVILHDFDFSYLLIENKENFDFFEDSLFGEYLHNNYQISKIEITELNSLYLLEK